MSSLDFNQLFHPTKLFADYLGGRLGDYYRHTFLDPDGPGKVAARIDEKRIDRRLLHNVVLEGNKRLGASEETLQNIELLGQPGTLCVFSGQQTAILGGPMYTIYKALTAVKLAEKYQRILGRPVVPCFWMATDDHDFEEVRAIGFLKRSGELTFVSYKPSNEPAGVAVADIVFDENVLELVDDVEKCLIDTEFKPSLVEIVRECYSPKRGLSQAFGRLFNQFLGRWGIVIVDPNFPGLKEVFGDVFRTEILHHDQTHRIFEQRTDQLLKNGYHAQVHKVGENLNLFYNDGKRRNIVISGDSYSPNGSGETFVPSELLDIAKKSPQKFSTNVLLRPIAQCRAFPTLCQVVGPSELAYFAQIEPLFDYFDVPFPIIYPRSGLTIVEPHIGRILGKYGLNLPDLKKDPERTIGMVIEKIFPSEAAEAVMSMQAHFENDFDKYTGMLKKADPDGYQLVLNFKKHVNFELKQLQKKLKASNKKRHDELAAQIRKAYAFLFPAKKLQERVLSPVYFANKFGDDIFQKIFDALEVDKPGHYVLKL